MSLKHQKEVEPNEILLVIDSMTGQDAVNVAKSFNELLDITGVILTKLDGDTRGGAALSVKAVTGRPIKFAGTGEKLDDIEVSTPTEWQAVFSAWVMCLLSLRTHRIKWMPKSRRNGSEDDEQQIRL